MKELIFLVPFMIAVLVWPIVTFLSIFLIGKILKPLFISINNINLRLNIKNMATLIPSQVIVAIIVKEIYGLFHLKPTSWLNQPFLGWWAIWILFWQNLDQLKARYEIETPSYEKKMGGWWTLGMFIGWTICMFLLEH